MRRIVFASLVLMAMLVPVTASAKLPFFGFDVTPTRADVGEPITITMTCYDDAAHTLASSGCFGAGDSMAWVHPLDTDGDLDRGDWLAVVGRATPTGTVRGSIVLVEPGAYDVLPLWRGWGSDHGRGFPDPIRIEVGGRAPIVPIAAVGIGLGGISIVVAVRQPRRSLNR